jgi:Rrf2 family protein
LTGKGRPCTINKIKRSGYLEMTVRFSQSSKYAILALTALAARDGGPATVHELAEAAGVPQAYLAKLVPPLARAGLLASSRGRGGGVHLARPAGGIALADVIRALDGEGVFQECPFEVAPCPGNPACPLQPVWDPLRARIVDFLAATTLADVTRKIGSPALRARRRFA